MWVSIRHTPLPPGGWGVADTLDPPSRSAAESSRVYFSLWTYSPLTSDWLSWVEVGSLTDWLHGAFRWQMILPNERCEASAVIVKLKKARTIGRIQTSSSIFIITVNSAMAEVSELGNLLTAKIIIQTVIRRCKVCNSTGFFLAWTCMQ